jgi:hypothetical protein
MVPPNKSEDIEEDTKITLSELEIMSNHENNISLVEIPSPKQKIMLICIPCVEEKISNKFIFKVFCNLQIGFIESMQEYTVKHKEYYKRIVIRVKLNKSDMAKYIQTRFDEGKNIKIVYSMPWYWICVLCRENISPRIR